MKIIGTVLALIALSGCGGKTIVYKGYPSKDSICQYKYHYGADDFEFFDSCSLYHISDKIK